MAKTLTAAHSVGLINLRTVQTAYIVRFEMTLHGVDLAMSLEFAHAPKQADNKSRDMLDDFGSFFGAWIDGFRAAPSGIDLKAITGFKANTETFFAKNHPEWAFTELLLDGESLSHARLLELVFEIQRMQNTLRAAA